VLGQRTQWLLTGESIAQAGPLMRRHGLGLCAAPPFARLLCAILFGLPGWRQDVLGGPSADVGASWTHADRGERGGVREGLPVRELPGEAVGAMHGRGRTVGRAIEGDQQRITQPTQGVEPAVRLELLEEGLKHGLAGARRERSQQGADLLGTGHLLDAQQRLGVIAPWGVLQAALGL